MNTYVKPPSPLSDTGDMTQNWKKWKQDFIIFIEAYNSMNDSKELKAQLLRFHIGNIGQQAIEKIGLNDLDLKDDTKILLKLDKYFDPPTEIEERYYFFSTHKKQTESIEQYINVLKEKAVTCNFGDMTDKLIRDKIIAECTNKQLREKLFKVKDLNLTKLISIFNKHKSVTLKKKETVSNDTSIKTIKDYDKIVTNSCNDNKSNNVYHRRNCKKCNQRHPMKACPAWGFKCEKCGMRNHYTYCCPFFFTNNEGNQERINTNIDINVSKENQKVHPTAPALSDVDKKMYPDLSYMRTSQGNMNMNEWSWTNQVTKNTNENMQKNETSPILKTQHKFGTEITPTMTKANIKDKTSQNECLIS